MNVLSIEQHPTRKNQYAAFLNGVEIPMVTKIAIESDCGSLTTVSIVCVVAKTNQSEVVIKELSVDK